MSTSVSVNKKPPGPKKTWFGLPLANELKNDTLGLMQRLNREYGDVVYFEIATLKFYFLYSPELIRQAIVTHADDFIRHERGMEVFALIYGDNVMTTNGQVWKRQRRILTPGFAPKKVAGYTRLMGDATLDSFDMIFPQGKGESTLIDVDRFSTKLTMDVILRVLFSHKASEEESDRVSAAVRSLEHQCERELMWAKTPPDWVPFPGRKQKRQDKANIDNLIREQIQLRRDMPSEERENNDYLDMLLNAKDEEAEGDSSTATLSDTEIHDNCSVIFAAGHDTTASSLTWWIGLMCKHPEHVETVRQEIQEVMGDRNPTPEDLMKLKFLTATIKEAMRICPAVIGIFTRTAIRDVKIGEWDIAKGSAVGVSIWQVHHDERWYPEPEEFRPERFMPGANKIPRGAYLPFGIGPHVCIGQQLAMMELSMIAVRLLTQFDFEFMPGESLPKAKAEMLLMPETPLKINFIRR